MVILASFLLFLGIICIFIGNIIGINNDFSGKGNNLSRLKEYTCRLYNFFKGNMVNKNTTLPTDEPDIELSSDYKKYTKIGLVLMGIAVASVFISLFISEFFPQADFIKLFLIPIIGVGVTIGPLIVMASITYELFNCEVSNSPDSKETQN